MSQKLKIGEEVFVPATIVKLSNNGFALYKTTIVATDKKSIKVNLPGGNVSEFIGSSLAHCNTGIMIVTIGDNKTEDTLLVPLRKSVLQFSRLLFKDDYILSVFCRSLKEFKLLWDKYNCSYSYLVIIGHGDKGGFEFGVDGHVSASDFLGVIEASSCSAKHIISLCCNTGYKTTGAVFSNSKKCLSYIAPFQSIHGAEASQFLQTFLINHLLNGQSTKVAYKNSNALFASKNTFRLWTNGKLTTK